MIEKLQKTIQENWGLIFTEIDQSLTLLNLSEQIACQSENCTLSEAYAMNIGDENLHLPGLIAFYIIDELGYDFQKINAGMTLSSIFSDPK